MAAIRDSSRRSLHRHLHPPGSSSRYAAFDGSTESDRRSKSTSSTFSNKWEIALVTIIVAAGIVITTIAAIKAHERPEDDLIKSANDLDIRTTNHTNHHKTPKYFDKKKKVSSTTTETSLSTAPHLIPGNYFPTNQPNNNHNHHNQNHGNNGLGIAGIRVQVPTEPDLPEMIETTDRPVTMKAIEVSRPDPIIPEKVDDFNGKLFFDDTYSNFYQPDYEITPDYDPINKFRHHHSQNPSPAASEDVASRTMLSGQSVQEVRDPIASSESIQPNVEMTPHHVMNGMINNANSNHDGLPGFPPPRGSFINGDHSRTAELAADGAGFIIDDTHTFGSFMDGSSHVIDRTPKTRQHHHHHDQGDGNSNNNNLNRFSPRLENKHHDQQHAIASSIGHQHHHTNLVHNQQQEQAQHENVNNNNNNNRFNNQFPVYSPASNAAVQSSASNVQSSASSGIGQASSSSSSPSLQKLPVFITASSSSSSSADEGSVRKDNNNNNNLIQNQNYGSGYTQGNIGPNNNNNGQQSFYHQLSQQQHQGPQMLAQQQSHQIPLGMPMAGLLSMSSNNNNNVNNNYPDSNQFNAYHSAPPQSASSNLMSASLGHVTTSKLPGITSFAKPLSPSSSGSQVVEKLSAAAQSIAASFIPPSLFPRRLGNLLPASLFNPAASNYNPRIDHLPTLTHHDNYANRYKRSLVTNMREIKSNHYPSASNNTDAKVREMTASESNYFNYDEDDDNNSFGRNIPPPIFDTSLRSGFEGSSSNNNRRGSSRRRGRARSIARNAYTSEESKKSYGILGSGNFEVIRGGIYGDDGSESSESYRTHRNHPPPPPIDDYDDASNNRKRYSFGSSDDSGDTDYFAPKDHHPVLGFQGYDNFQLASNQEEDKSDLDKSASVPIIDAVHSHKVPSTTTHQLTSSRSNSYSSHTGTVMLDSDQDLMADS